MLVAGIDPGLQNSGLALLKKEGNSIELIEVQLIQNRKADVFSIRLKTIFDAITDFLKRNRPDEVALEEVFYAKNAQVALKMGHARGAAILAAANLGIPIAEYSPREIKLALTGNGNASKHQVQQMVYQILNLKEIPRSYDVTDAIAVAYCHCQRTIR